MKDNIYIQLKTLCLLASSAQICHTFLPFLLKVLSSVRCPFPMNPVLTFRLKSMLIFPQNDDQLLNSFTTQRHIQLRAKLKQVSSKVAFLNTLSPATVVFHPGNG